MIESIKLMLAVGALVGTVAVTATVIRDDKPAETVGEGWRAEFIEPGGTSLDGILLTEADCEDATIGHLWDGAELFTDSNGNGDWDIGEPFTDTNGNGKWDGSGIDCTLLPDKVSDFPTTEGCATQYQWLQWRHLSGCAPGEAVAASCVPAAGSPCEYLRYERTYHNYAVAGCNTRLAAIEAASDADLAAAVTAYKTYNSGVCQIALPAGFPANAASGTACQNAADWRAYRQNPDCGPAYCTDLAYATEAACEADGVDEIWVDPSVTRPVLSLSQLKAECRVAHDANVARYSTLALSSGELARRTAVSDERRKGCERSYQILIDCGNDQTCIEHETHKRACDAITGPFTDLDGNTAAQAQRRTACNNRANPTRTAGTPAARCATDRLPGETQADCEKRLTTAAQTDPETCKTQWADWLADRNKQYGPDAYKADGTPDPTLPAFPATPDYTKYNLYADCMGF